MGFEMEFRSHDNFFDTATKILPTPIARIKKSQHHSDINKESLT
jgi:hypothetical protein